MEKPQQAYWGVIPGELRRDETLPANAKLLYVDISSLTSQKGFCYASNEYLAGLYGWTERSVQRLIAALAERGYIQVEMVPGKERRIYAGAFLGGRQNCHPRQNCQGGGDKIVTPHNVDKDNNNTPPKAPQGGKRVASVPKWKPERFEAFWAYYREHARGEDRAGAAREWDRLKPDDDLIRIMGQALQAQVASEDWKRGIGIPYACRWLKNRRWEDYAGPLDKAGSGRSAMYTVGSDLPQW